jgi:TonB-dependent starch-binding outer membrane protein SusC
MKSNLFAVKIIALTSLAFIFCSETGLKAQQKSQTISGKVTDENGKGLSGVTVTVKGSKGTSASVVTAEDGSYQITTSAGKKVAEFSHVGYAPQSISIDNRSVINLSMGLSQKELESVVVVGYGSQRKKDVTGAVAQLDASKFEERPISQLAQAMQGQMAGVQVRTTTGAPGAELQVKVRGTASVNSGTDPLYVVDGVPIDNLGDINPTDIASIDVLKDAASTAIYGSRGTNGVVLITTKKGRSGKTKFNFNSYYGVQQLANKMDLLNGPEWIDMYQQVQDSAYVKRGLQSGFNWSATDPISVRQANLNTLKSSTYIPDSRWALGTDSLSYIDWQDAFYRNAPMANYQLSASGGSDKLTYRISGNYLDQDGIATSSNYQLFSVRANFEGKLNNFLKMGLELAPSYSWNSGGNVDGKDAQSHHVLAIAPVTEKDAGINSGVAPYGRYYYAGSTQSPIAYQRLTTNDLNRQRLLSNMYLQADIYKGLAFKVTGAWNTDQQNHKTYHPSIGLGQVPGANSSGSYTTANSQYYLIESSLLYNRAFGDHHINAIALYSAEQTNNVSTSQSASKFANDALTTLNNATSTVTASSTGELKRTLLSYLARVQYDYKDKYLLNASIRRDGSSKFGSSVKWGNFPAIGVGWNVVQESFMNSLTFISQLKLRASYGYNGNNDIDDYLAYGGIAASNYSFGNALINGYVPSSISNPDLHWEKTRSANYGIDLGLFNNRISLSADYYDKLTTDMLLDVPFALSTGFASGTENIGHMTNKGWEFEVNTRNMTGILQWQTGINLSFNKNEVTALGVGNAPIHTGFSNQTQVDQVGQPVNEFYMYDAIGVYMNAKDLASSSHMPTNIVGDVKYRDINGDDSITSDDRILMGQPDPKTTWGIYNNFTFKNFDLSFLIQGSGGNKVYDLIGRAIDRPGMGTLGNAMGRWRNRWRSEDEPGDGQTPRIDGTTGGLYDSRWLYDGTYARFKNLTVGYTMPHNLIKGITNARIYVSGENLFYLSNKDYGGYSPESLNTNGGDYGAYPDARTYIVGINIGF